MNKKFDKNILVEGTEIAYQIDTSLFPRKNEKRT